ncbi:hypothetical protein K501DRAFT_336350 [Backusella circina FSU 941]|nr:hypothetical protein K501DRAFT_336350 [Backusella circina FSU 941]
MPPTHQVPLRSYLGIAQVKFFNPYSMGTSPLKNNYMPFRKRLRYLIDREQLDEAIQLFRQLVQSNRFSIEHVWQVGAEIIGKLSPEHILDYLKAVYISSSERKSLVTFNAFLDILLQTKEYVEAFSEIEVRHKNANYNHPIILRKYALCAYQLWLKKYNEIPDDYFEDFETKYLPSGYSTLESKATSLLDDIHSLLPTDNELTMTCLQFLKYTQKDQQIELTTRRSLNACLLEENTSLVTYLLQHYNDVIDDNTRERSLIFLYEKHPTVDESVGLTMYVDIMGNKLDEARHSISEADTDEGDDSINEDYQSLNDVDLIATKMITVFLNRIEVGSCSPHFIKVLKNKVFDTPSHAVIAHCEELDFIGKVKNTVNNTAMVEIIQLLQEKLDIKHQKQVKFNNNVFNLEDYSFHPLF